MSRCRGSNRQVATRTPAADEVRGGWGKRARCRGKSTAGVKERGSAERRGESLVRVVVVEGGGDVGVELACRLVSPR
jgi:hypothetical protein